MLRYFTVLSIVILTRVVVAQDIITLSKALDIAAHHSLDLKQSALILKRSEENLKAQKAGLKSDFDLSLDPFSYSNQLKYDDRPDGDGWYNVEQTTSSGLFSISQPLLVSDATLGLSNYLQWQNANGDKSFYNKLTLSIDQPLFVHNVQKMALKEVELDVENAQLNYALKKLSMETSITQAFYNVYTLQMQLLVYEEACVSQKQNHAIVIRKVESGLSDLEELYQSEINLVSAENSKLNAQVNLENAKDAFKVQIGMQFDYDFLAVVNVSTTAVSVDLKRSIDLALNATVELRQREINIDLAQLSLISTQDDEKFQGNLSLQFGLTGQDEAIDKLYDKTTNNTSIGFSLEVPIWDWGRRHALIRSSQLSLDYQKLLLKSDIIDIELTLRQLERKISSLYLQIEMSQKNVRNAQLTYDINVERYQKGQLSGMDLQLIQNQLSQKKMAQTNAVIDYKIQLLNMKIQTLYDWETQENYIPENLFSNEKHTLYQ